MFGILDQPHLAPMTKTKDVQSPLSLVAAIRVLLDYQQETTQIEWHRYTQPYSARR